MLSGKARAKARILDHDLRWNVTDAMAKAIPSVFAPRRPEWPTGPAQKFARTARAKVMAQRNAQAKAEGSIPSQAKAKVKMQQKAMAKDTEAKAMEARAMERAHLEKARVRRAASTAWTTRTGMESTTTNGLNGPQPKLQQPRGLQPRQPQLQLLLGRPRSRNILG